VENWDNPSDWENVPARHIRSGLSLSSSRKTGTRSKKKTMPPSRFFHFVYPQEIDMDSGLTKPEIHAGLKDCSRGGKILCASLVFDPRRARRS
jgi:hypothetical protein